MKILFLSLTILFSFQAFSSEEKLFCSGDGVRSTLFYWDGVNSYEFVDINFQGPKYLETYLACTNYLLSLKDEDRTRRIDYVLLLNAVKKSFVRFAEGEKKIFYEHCLQDSNCQVKFPYFLLEPAIFLKQLTSKKKSMECEDERPELLPIPIKMSSEITEINFWELPKDDLVQQFWKVAKADQYEKIIISSMSISLTFLDQLIKRYKDSPTTIYLMTSFNIMSMDDELLKLLPKLPSNIHFIPIYQSSREPYSHHQKGAIFLSDKKPVVIWNSANFRKYETHKLFDIGMTLADKDLADALLHRWMTTAQNSCTELKYQDCSLNLRYSSSQASLALWKDVTKKGCDKLPVISQTPSDSPDAMTLTLSLISSAKKSIKVHSHVFGDSLILGALKAAQARGIDVKVIVGKTGKAFRLPWVRTVIAAREHHAKFMLIDDSTYFWGTGNITKTSFSNQREDFFYGNNQKIIEELKSYFERSWKNCTT